MISIWNLLFGWLPNFVQIVIFGLFALMIVLIVVRVVKIILDAIPFI